MSKNLIIVIFILLIAFMICDLIFTFGNLFKGIVYGTLFIVGLVIYFAFREVPKKDSEND